MKKYLRAVQILSIAVLLFLSFSFAEAQGIPGLGGVGKPPGLSDQQLGLGYGAATGLSPTDPRITIARIIQIALGLLGTAMVVMVIYAGFLWFSAGGNDEKIGEAKKWLSASIIGLAIILSAYAIASFVVSSLVSATNYGVVPLQLF